MILEYALLVAQLLIALAVTWRRNATQLAVGLWVIFGSIAIYVFAPLGLDPLGMTAVVVVFAGSLALAAPSLISPRIRNVPRADQGDPAGAHGRLFVASIVVLVMVGIGFLAFRHSIEVATGVNYSSLTLRQIRAAENGAARNDSSLALLSSASAILGCLGVYGALRYHLAWLSLTVIALLVVVQNPARLTSISLIVIVMAFFLYMRHILRPRRVSRRRRLGRTASVLLPSAAVAIAAVAAVVVFNVVGTELHKNQATASVLRHYPLPAWTESPFLYFAGGFPALSQAIAHKFAPFDAGASLYIIPKIASYVVRSVSVPNTVGKYVGIPIPFNVYTGFGSVYFDVGIIGVIVVFLLVGWLAVFSHRGAREGRPEWAWVSSLLFSALLTLPQSFIVLHLDVDFEFVLGFAVFWYIRRNPRVRWRQSENTRTGFSRRSPRARAVVRGD